MSFSKINNIDSCLNNEPNLEYQRIDYIKGFDHRIFFVEISECYVCGFCEYVLREAMQSSCGHRYCFLCTKLIAAEEGKEKEMFCKLCKEDGISTKLDKILEYIPDRATNRYLSKLETQCLNIGCEWKGILRDYILHEKSCKSLHDSCCSEVSENAVINLEINTLQTTLADNEKKLKVQKRINEELEDKLIHRGDQIKQMLCECNALSRRLVLKDILLSERSLRLTALESISTDGSLIWKIEEYQRKVLDAQSGKIQSIYSPFFYTSPNGYKLCVRMYPNGDGFGKGTHISLFLVLSKGNFDALLQWPFKQRTSFMLLDQNNREHIVDSFNPDPKSQSFHRPTTEMNVASGCPVFVPQAILTGENNGYLREDAIFIKVIVDTTGDCSY